MLKRVHEVNFMLVRISQFKEEEKILKKVGGWEPLGLFGIKRRPSKTGLKRGF